MRLDNRHEIESFLGLYNNFEECIIEDLFFKSYGTILTVCLDIIWTEDRQIRQNLEEKELICFSFLNLQEFKLYNDLNEKMIEEPEAINWGINEIALVKLDSDYYISNLPKHFYKIFFIWESNRKIEIVFSEIEVQKQEATRQHCQR